jgi:hypothetical protein
MRGFTKGTTGSLSYIPLAMHSSACGRPRSRAEGAHAADTIVDALSKTGGMTMYGREA